eukprot:66065-Rhodomonas_salina.1
MLLGATIDVDTGHVTPRTQKDKVILPPMPADTASARASLAILDRICWGTEGRGGQEDRGDERASERKGKNGVGKRSSRERERVHSRNFFSPAKLRHSRQPRAQQHCNLGEWGSSKSLHNRRL